MRCCALGDALALVRGDRRIAASRCVDVAARQRLLDLQDQRVVGAVARADHGVVVDADAAGAGDLERDVVRRVAVEHLLAARADASSRYGAERRRAPSPLPRSGTRDELRRCCRRSACLPSGPGAHSSSRACSGEIRSAFASTRPTGPSLAKRCTT